MVVVDRRRCFHRRVILCIIIVVVAAVAAVAAVVSVVAAVVASVVDVSNIYQQIQSEEVLRIDHTFPMKSNRLKTAIKTTGIQLWRRQLITSDSMPGKRQSVTK